MRLIIKIIVIVLTCIGIFNVKFHPCLYLMYTLKYGSKFNFDEVCQIIMLIMITLIIMLIIIILIHPYKLSSCNKRKYGYEHIRVYYALKTF